METPPYVSYYESPLGWMELRATSEKLTSSRFVSERGKQVFHPLLGDVQFQLNEYFAGKRKAFDLPLSLEGTAFQQKVWQQLRNLPYAGTISYIALARETGDEKATRAVAAANAKNHIALIVPCHRVIGSDGRPVGYAWEIWRKRWLLQHEQRYSGVGQLWLF
ncbi:methylated-DNA--[protein]-cysteine S-methyltransferase [Siphonobacter aquaeclarae]|uniref:methylated-DNA--[protein]-cysteine S-methyltransferase n=1 Tax=Siphonobacter aquaeclarae TaxID=563176 RepID=A0A1G9L7P2_9BACT|nr:methylated-DNA--[protein]-cysteine S-methyltransferase [Siphonobacter aquaeclarae]SDL57826.1 methylated-DNA-[protein]-cysteine S-methyltransferase [Siphonobacter aquaeclarae]